MGPTLVLQEKPAKGRSEGYWIWPGAAKNLPGPPIGEAVWAMIWNVPPIVSPPLLLSSEYVIQSCVFVACFGFLVYTNTCYWGRREGVWRRAEKTDIASYFVTQKIQMYPVAAAGKLIGKNSKSHALYVSLLCLKLKLKSKSKLKCLLWFSSEEGAVKKANWQHIYHWLL